MLEDCNLCLNIDPKNLKALLRRGIAFEGLEKHKLALQGITLYYFIVISCRFQASTRA